MRDIIENWQGTDAELLAELNAPSESLKAFTPNPHGQPGKFGYRGMAEVNQTLATNFTYTLRQIADGLKQAVIGEPPQPDHVSRALGVVIDGFTNILFTDPVGLDFTSDDIHNQLSQLLTSAGWQPESIAAVLAFGYTLKNPAQVALNRNAIQSDVDAVRAVIRREELQFAYQEGFTTTIQPALQTGTQAEIVAAIKAVADAVEGV